MIVAADSTTTLGTVLAGVFAFAIAFLTYRSTKQKIDADEIKAQIDAGQQAMKNSQAIYESAAGFSERQNAKLRIDLDAAYALIDELHRQMIAQDLECNRKLDALDAELRALKAKRHE